MSTTQPTVRTAAPPLRVRDQAREAAVLIAFSAATACGLALALLLLFTRDAAHMATIWWTSSRRRSTPIS